MGYRHDPHGSYSEQDSGQPHESGLEDARREAARLACYLQSGPPRALTGGAPRPPQLLLHDWPIPPNTLSVYAIGQAMVLRGDFTQADLVALRQTFQDQLITLDDGDDEAHHTLVIWPPRLEEGSEEEGDEEGADDGGDPSGRTGG